MKLCENIISLSWRFCHYVVLFFIWYWRWRLIKLLFFYILKFKLISYKLCSLHCRGGNIMDLLLNNYKWETSSFFVYICLKTKLSTHQNTKCFLQQCNPSCQSGTSDDILIQSFHPISLGLPGHVDNIDIDVA